MPTIIHQEYIVQTGSGSCYRLTFKPESTRCKFSAKKLHSDASDFSHNDLDIVDIRPAAGRKAKNLVYPGTLNLSNIKLVARLIFTNIIGLDYNKMDMEQFSQFMLMSKKCKRSNMITKIYQLKGKLKKDS